MKPAKVRSLLRIIIFLLTLSLPATVSAQSFLSYRSVIDEVDPVAVTELESENEKLVLTSQEKPATENQEVESVADVTTDSESFWDKYIVLSKEPETINPGEQFNQNASEAVVDSFWDDSVVISPESPAISAQETEEGLTVSEADELPTQPSAEKMLITILPGAKNEPALPRPPVEDGIRIGYGLSEALIAYAQYLIDTELYSNALKVLENVYGYFDENPGQGKTQRLNEAWLRLLITTQFHLEAFDDLVDIADFYIRSYFHGEKFNQVYYYYSIALNNLGRPLDYTYLVTDDLLNELSEDENLLLRRLLSEDAIQKDDLLSAMDFLLDEEYNIIDGFEKSVTDLIERIDNVSDANIFIVLYNNPTIRSLANIRKIHLFIDESEYAAAEEFIDRLFLEENINYETLDEIQRLREYIKTALKTVPNRVGVILPFSHKHPLFRLLAEQVKDGLELALRDFSDQEKPFELVFKDSARDLTESVESGDSIAVSIDDRADLVKARVRELVEEDRVIAILGPLAKDTSLAAGEMAERYKVPIISFSQTENLGKGLPYLFRFQRNQIQEAKFLARYACDYLQAERFVIFYNEDRSGKGYEIAQAFEDEITARGAKIVGVTRVGRSSVDFKQNYLAMTGGLKPMTEEDEKELKLSGEKLTPEVDFDAMFVPTSINQLGIILAFNRSFNADKAWVLSGSDINIQENQLLSRTWRLRFVDSFPISSVRTYLQPFYEAHWRNYNFRENYRPPTDYTIYAYEALEVLVKLLNNPKNHYREPLKKAISQLSSLPILTGDVSVSENGEFENKMNILRIRNKTTVPVF